MISVIAVPLAKALYDKGSLREYDLHNGNLYR